MKLYDFREAQSTLRVEGLRETERERLDITKKILKP